MDPFTVGSAYINDFQVEILDECLSKGSGGLSLPMGSGKTLLSLLVALHLTDDQILFVCSKSLLQGVITEVHKFFGDSLSYKVLHREYCNIEDFNPDPTTRLIITTIDVCAKAYKSFEISGHFIFREPPEHFGPTIVHYLPQRNPYLPGRVGLGYIYAKRWGCLIVDEVQDYTKITTNNCQSLGALCCKHRWLLSGTMFNEPSPERILGYHIILNHPDFPRNLPEATTLISTLGFGGVRSTTVHREENQAFAPPPVNKVTITHSLSKEEGLIYSTMRETLKELNKRLEELKRQRAESDDIKRFNSYLLAMLTYLREGLICPIIPLASVTIDLADFTRKDDLADILTNKIKELGIDSWLDDVKSVKSTRIKEIIKIIKKHPKDRLTLFSCFRSCIDILCRYIPKNRPVFTITGGMSGPRRGQVIKEFGESKNGILLLTYKIGGQGLNLQCSNTVLLIDYWWNAGMTNQAIARILRYGQQAKIVNVYLFSSNTGVENAVLKKQSTKLAAVNELQTGHQTTKIHKMKIQDIIKLIDVHENRQLLKEIYQ